MNTLNKRLVAAGFVACLTTFGLAGCSTDEAAEDPTSSVEDEVTEDVAPEEEVPEDEATDEAVPEDEATEDGAEDMAPEDEATEEAPAEEPAQ